MAGLGKGQLPVSGYRKVLNSFGFHFSSYHSYGLKIFSIRYRRWCQSFLWLYGAALPARSLKEDINFSIAYNTDKFCCLVIFLFTKKNKAFVWKPLPSLSKVMLFKKHLASYK